MEVYALVIDGSTCKLALHVKPNGKNMMDPEQTVYFEDYVAQWKNDGFATIFGTHDHIMFHAIVYLKVKVVTTPTLIKQ
jgi:hypothetical protein